MAKLMATLKFFMQGLRNIKSELDALEEDSDEESDNERNGIK